MQFIKSTPARGFRIQAAAALGALLAASANAQNPSRFERLPDERRKFVQEMAERSAKDRAEVEAWARQHGVAVREKRGGKVYQIDAIRNGKPSYLVTHNANAGISSAANLVWPAPYGLNGSGITVGVWDASKALDSHQEFGGRVNVHPGQTEPLDDHSTHVCGTIAASGLFDPRAKGMAPSVSVKSYDWNNDLGEMGQIAASSSGDASRIHLSNHSYGWGVGWESGENLGNQIEFGQYSFRSVAIDQLVSGSRYYLPFCSAGNDQYEDRTHNNSGYETISHYAVAKNVMTVGAVSDAVSGGVRSISSAGITSFSSMGPTDDGRVKPDIVANGYSLFSTVSSGNSAYEETFVFNGVTYSWSGTSMASPSACGSAALLVDYYKELFSGGAMWASTLKGLIIHTADDRGTTGPDYKYGWGLINTKAAADLLKDVASGSLSRLTEAELSTANPVDSFTVFSGGNEPLRVTLCWTDPPGPDQSALDNDRNQDVINDLDIRVIGPNGVVAYPYKLNVASPTSAATRGENNVDNVEQVYILAPAMGEYMIIIDHDGTLAAGEQEYSLLISGISADTDGDGLSDGWESMYFASPTGAVATADSDGDGSDNYAEFVAGTNPTNPASVFKISAHKASAGGTPFIINWTTVPGRVYTVGYTYNLVYVPFENNILAANLPHTVNSYTDTVQRAEQQIFYRVDAKPGQ